MGLSELGDGSYRNLATLLIGHNTMLSGPLPKWDVPRRLDTLSELQVSYCNLNGPVPAWDKLTNLSLVNLGGNQLSGKNY